MPLHARQWSAACMQAPARMQAGSCTHACGMLAGRRGVQASSRGAPERLWHGEAAAELRQDLQLPLRVPVQTRQVNGAQAARQRRAAGCGWWQLLIKLEVQVGAQRQALRSATMCPSDLSIDACMNRECCIARQVNLMT